MVKKVDRELDGALPGSLTEKELTLVGHVKDTYRKQVKVGCMGCYYCLHYSQGVNIPYCFECYNNMSLRGPMMTKMMYMMYVGDGIDGSGKNGYASRCKSCGKCVKACTQYIDIPGELKNVANAVEGPDMKVIGFIFRLAFSSYLRFDRRRNCRKAWV